MSQDNKKEIHLQPDMPEQGIEFAHRRQVIRGLASLPVALTLSSGAAVASSSNHQMCLTLEDREPPDCDTGTLLQYWHTERVDHPSQFMPEKSCGTYAQSNGGGGYSVTGYRYTHNYNTYYIGADGQTVLSGRPAGNALTASCATSFMVSGGTGLGGGG